VRPSLIEQRAEGQALIAGEGHPAMLATGGRQRNGLRRATRPGAG
jgi:hypothetical protein